MTETLDINYKGKFHSPSSEQANNQIEINGSVRDIHHYLLSFLCVEFLPAKNGKEKNYLGTVGLIV